MVKKKLRYTYTYVHTNWQFQEKLQAGKTQSAAKKERKKCCVAGDLNARRAKVTRFFFRSGIDGVASRV